MSAPNSPTDICNLALDHLKHAPISNVAIGDDSVTKLCRRWFETTKRATLRRHTWNFATARTTLAALSPAPSFEYSAHFQLPNDFIRPVNIGETPVDQYKYTIEGRKLLINYESALPLVYIYNTTTVLEWDPLFVHILSLELAIRMGRALGVAMNEIAALKDMVDDHWLEAASIDGQERPPTRIETSRFKSARRGFGRGRLSAGSRYDFEE